MITKVKINNKKNSPIPHISDLTIFDKHNEFDFKPGINIIVGPNGSGKSTLLKLIERYLLIETDSQSFNNLSALFKIGCISESSFFDGVDVYSDYKLSSFRFVHMDELSKGRSDKWLSSIENFQASYMAMNSSTGEAVKVALMRLFQRMFSEKAELKFPLKDIEYNIEHGNPVWQDYAKRYKEYIEKHRIPFNRSDAEYTVFLDEPDRNLDIFNINEIYPILSQRKEHTQIVAVIHNPLLIYKLSKIDGINWIEMEEGYVNKIKNAIKTLIEWH